MQRQEFIKISISGLGGFVIGCTPARKLSLQGKGSKKGPPFRYHLPSELLAPIIPLPEGTRVPFGWNWFGLHEEVTIIRFTKTPGQKPASALFRVTTSIDVREQKLVEVFLPVTKRLLGKLDIKYSPVFQPFEIALTAEDVEQVFTQGIALKQTKGNTPLWLLQPNSDAGASNSGLMPHLLFMQHEMDKIKAFQAHFFSLNVVQSFGWMEGCVLDGLLDMRKGPHAEKSAALLNEHLNLFFDSQSNLVYEGPFSKPYTNSFYGIEALLPFAAIAQLHPDHALLLKVAAFCKEKVNEAGLIQEKQLTTEGCYTVAYPLAAIAIAKGETDLAKLAIRQLTGRKERLVQNNNIHQKMDENLALSYANWARGVSWYMLGIVRTLSLLDGSSLLTTEMNMEVAVLKKEFQRAARWALQFQDPSGLWFCFLDQPRTGIDTSGSAGIGAALAIGAANKYLPNDCHQGAKKTLAGLLQYITTDGFLAGAAQANKGGIALQENGYRVISQYASGLMAQLYAALDKLENHDTKNSPR